MTADRPTLTVIVPARRGLPPLELRYRIVVPSHHRNTIYSYTTAAKTADSRGWTMPAHRFGTSRALLLDLPGPDTDSATDPPLDLHVVLCQVEPQLREPLAQARREPNGPAAIIALLCSALEVVLSVQYCDRTTTRRTIEAAVNRWINDYPDYLTLRAA